MTIEKMKLSLLAELCRQREVPMRANEAEIDFDGMTVNQVDFDALARVARDFDKNNPSPVALVVLSPGEFKRWREYAGNVDEQGEGWFMRGGIRYQEASLIPIGVYHGGRKL